MTEYRIEVHCTVYGFSERNRVANDDVVTFGNGLTNAFSRSNSVVATFGSSSVAVFRQRNTYYIFDSHSRNGFVEVDPEGACVLLQFSSRDALCNYLFHMYEGHFFNLSPVTFHSTHLSSSADATSSNNSHNPLSDHPYSSFKQSKPKKRNHMQSDRNLNENSGISVSINNADCTQPEYENLHENVGCYTEVDSLSSAATCNGCAAQESGVGSVHSQQAMRNLFVEHQHIFVNHVYDFCLKI